MNSATTGKPFVISRTFRAPRKLVWKAWTDQEELKKWFGPTGMEMIVAKMDLRPGGVFHYGLKMPDGNTMWGLWKFVALQEPERIELIQSFSDKDGGLGRHPMAPDWPRYMHSVTTLVENNGETTLTITASPCEATAAEQAIFDASREGMTGGWGGTFAKLEEYLAALK